MFTSIPQVVVCTRDLTRLLEHDTASKVPSYTAAPTEDLPRLSASEMSRRPELSTAYAGPRNQVEHTIVDTWQRFFGIKPVGIHDDFFELGGDSLKVNTMASFLHKQLNVEIPLVEFFNRPTIAKLVDYIQGAETTAFLAIEPAEKKDYYPLTSAQKRIYIVRQLDLENTAYNQPMVLALKGKLDREKLGKTFKALIKRHESLRT
ncbi:MAG: hypothetical protein GY950_09780, partial [bacterium]|nr:hypothetical protein [bacterium]